MSRRAIHTDRAPKALGPYSQAILSGDTLYCSGQVGIDPAKGTIVATEVAGQTRQVMKNLGAVLAAAEMTFADVVKTTIFLSSMDDFDTVNAIYAEAVGTPPPARSTVEVSRLPKDARVEIEMIARRGGRS